MDISLPPSSRRWQVSPISEPEVSNSSLVPETPHTTADVKPVPHPNADVVEPVPPPDGEAAQNVEL